MGHVLADVYTSPYTATIGGSTNVSVICDDFTDESYVGEDWMAYVTPLSSIVSGPATNDPLMWSGASVTMPGPTTVILGQAQAYEVAAVLAVDILDSAAGSPAQQYYSYALWDLFAPPSAVSSWLASYGDSGLMTSYITPDLQSAVSYVLSSTNTVQVLADVDATTIYSYEPNTSSCNGVGCPTPTPQEFITVNMAEPPAPALLGMDLSGLAGLILIARRFGWLAR